METRKFPDLIRLVLLTAGIFIVIQAGGQDNRKYTDSLRTSAEQAHADSSRVDALLELGYVYQWVDIDSGMYFVKMADSLSKMMKDERRMIKSLCRMSNMLSILGKDSAALNMVSQARERAERLHDDGLMSSILLLQGGMYSELGQRDFGIKLQKQAQVLLERAADTKGQAMNLHNIGTTYLDMGKLDSALAFENKAYEITVRCDWKVDMMGTTLRSLGRIQQKMDNPDIAMAYYRRSIPYGQYFQDWIDLHLSALYIGELFEGSGKRDSALYYFRRSLAYAQLSSYKPDILASTMAMARMFRDSRPDSAFVYLERAMALKDSLTDEARVRLINNMVFSENRREELRMEDRRKEEESRRRNIRLLGISVFIITLFMMLMLLAGLKAHPKIVRFSGIIALLLLFEFITLLVHPLISKWTHEDPIWMLLIFVGLAAVIAPLHHRIEKWMVDSLSRSRERVVQKNG